MSKIQISGLEHTVEITHDGGDLVYLIERAQKLWADTKPELSTRPPGPALGFSASLDKQWNHDRQQGGMWRPVRAAE
jgi:hypothetical protein